jgi:drug/metabolite transporter (DMT)-like permease
MSQRASELRLSHGHAIAAMVACTLMWSSAGVVSRQLQATQGFEMTFWRSLFCAVSLLVMLPLIQGKHAWRTWPWKHGAFWLSGLCWAVMFTAFMMALTLTSVAAVLLTMSVGPLMTALLAWVVIRQPLPLRTWGAIVAAGVGMGWIFGAQLAGEGQGAMPAGAHPLLGLLVGLLVPLAGAVMWTIAQRAQAKGVSMDLVPSVLLGACMSALATLPLAWPLTAPTHDVAWLALLGLVQLAVPCSLAVVAARTLKAPEVSLLALLEVLFGIVWAWAFAGEQPGQAVVWGGSLVLGALVANELLGRSQAARA